MEFVPRLFPFPKQSFFLLGPRGTGKSTLVRSAYPDAIYIDLLAPDTYRAIAAHPERLREIVGGNPDAETIIIDEVQKVPDVLSVVHLLMEEKSGRQFILTGSSARKLRRSQTDLLAGRALARTLHPFMASELGGAFILDEALEIGMLPVVRGAAEPEEALKAYVSLYLREEIQAEGIVRNIGDFSRFLEALSFSHGAVINTSAIARECSVHRKVVEGYMGVIEDLLLAFRVPVFTRRAKRAMSAHPKLYLFDAGVYRSLRPHGPLDRSSEAAGAALEGLLAQHLRAWIAYGNRDDKLFFWRTRSGLEVDFIVYGASGIVALEVKNGTTVGPADVRGLKAFMEEYPDARTYLLYRGKERLRYRNVFCVPSIDFLRALHPARELAAALG